MNTLNVSILTKRHTRETLGLPAILVAKVKVQHDWANGNQLPRMGMKSYYIDSAGSFYSETTSGVHPTTKLPQRVKEALIAFKF